MRKRTPAKPFVALRKESVDRNKMPVPTCIYSKRSLSARRAWIEMYNATNRTWLLKSLSARRAWIEMSSVHEVFANFEVALRKESVDRNLWDLMGGLSCNGRSPQGERG